MGANEASRLVGSSRARGQRDSGDDGTREVRGRGEHAGPTVAVVGGVGSLLELREWSGVHVVIQPSETILWLLSCPSNYHRDGIDDGLARSRLVADMAAGRTGLARLPQGSGMLSTA